MCEDLVGRLRGTSHFAGKGARACLAGGTEVAVGDRSHMGRRAGGGRRRIGK